MEAATYRSTLGVREPAVSSLHASTTCRLKRNCFILKNAFEIVFIKTFDHSVVQSLMGIFSKYETPEGHREAAVQSRQMPVP